MNPADRAELLEPCPFCGSPAELEHDNDHHGEWFNLGCSNHWGRVEPDKACLGGRLFYTEDVEKEADAITAWNTRQPADPSNLQKMQSAPDTRLREAVTALAEELEADASVYKSETGLYLKGSAYSHAASRLRDILKDPPHDQ